MPIAQRCAVTDGATDPSGAAARFAAALERIWPEGTRDPSVRIGLAVSGGADSTAMLLLAERAIPGRFEVATVDHRLRAAAAAECAAVQRLCALKHLLCTVVEVQVAPGNVQAQARAARYAALAKWAENRGLSAICTAHQADDQAETVLLRLSRGSGVAGLAGIRETGAIPGEKIPLLRPMLGFTRAECETICTAVGVEWIRDPSNADDRFDRVRMRKLLAALPLGAPDAVLATAAHCADADRALDWAADREWAEQVAVADGHITYRPTAPRAIVIRVVERALATLGGQVRGGQAADMVDRLMAEKGSNAGGIMARNIRKTWVFEAEPPRRVSAGE